jgi:hypothetical protein
MVKARCLKRARTDLQTPWQALRILNLLEQHHKKLGQLLKSRHEKPLVEPQAQSVPEKTQSTPADSSSTATNAKDGPIRTPGTETVQKPPRLPLASRVPGRDLSSSIASNLATARGIPGNQQRRGVLVSPTVSAHHAGGRFSNDQAIPTHGADNARNSGNTGQAFFTSNEPHRKPSWTPPASAPEQEDQTQDEANKSSSDAPFQQFYNTFEALMSKLSAPLAFAGLPLTTTTTPPAASPAARTTTVAPGTKLKDPKPPAPVIPITAESLDYSQLISQAALRAVRDGAPSSNPAESFYVVPTEGGMASYSEIIQRTARDVSNYHHRQLSNISEDNDDFVDARETIPSPLISDSSAPGTAAHSRRGSARPGPAARSTDMPKVAGKTMEELALENQMLRQYLDSTSKRLRVFELSAQSSSAALAQSIRSLQRSPTVTPENSRGRADGSSSGRGGKGDEKARSRIAELEEILRKNDKELQRREKENAKLKDVVVRYREKWEKLKEGARARREGGGNGGGDRTPKNVEESLGD